MAKSERGGITSVSLSPKSVPIDTRWRSVAEWPAAERLPAVWSWLTHSGSLTRKLREFSGDSFHVEVLKETDVRLDSEDARLLDAMPGDAAKLREVYLCGIRPLVFGRTLTSGPDGAQWLEHLGTQPLGDRVFAEQNAVRGEIEVRRVTESDALFRDAVRGLAVTPAAVLWARRSVLTVQSVHLLIYECFLPGVNE